MGLTMPINGANLGLNSDSAMVGRCGTDNQASMMRCVQKKMKVAKPTTSACIDSGSSTCQDEHQGHVFGDTQLAPSREGTYPDSPSSLSQLPNEMS